MEFADTFHSSVEEELTNTLGRSVMMTLKNLLTHSFKSYAEKPAEFHRELSKIFGSASIMLEKMIVRELFHRLDLPYSSELDFHASVDLARNN